MLHDESVISRASARVAVAAQARQPPAASSNANGAAAVVLVVFEIPHCKSGSVLDNGLVKRSEVVKGRSVKFVGPEGTAPLTAPPSTHLLTDCIGRIVMGPSEDIWCYPDSPEMDMVWVAFVDDIKPIRQVSAAWLETD